MAGRKTRPSMPGERLRFALRARRRRPPAAPPWSLRFNCWEMNRQDTKTQRGRASLRRRGRSWSNADGAGGCGIACGAFVVFVIFVVQSLAP